MTRLARPVGLVLVLVAGVASLTFSIPSTGSVDPGGAVSFSLAELGRDVAPTVALLASLALLAMGWTAGRSGVRAAVAFLAGRELEADGEVAWRALLAGARATLAAGLLLGLLGAAALLANAGAASGAAAGPSPATMRQALDLTLHAPLLALLLGRVILGGAAAAAARRAGADPPFPLEHDLALTSLVVPLALATMIAFTRYPTIR